MRRWLITAAFFILVCGAAGMAATGSAKAASAQTAASVSQSVASQPAINYFILNTGCSGTTCTGFQKLACNDGTTYPVASGPGDIGVSNCSVRVWLHQNSNNTGYTL